MKALISTILLVAFGALLVATNPDRDDFADYVREQMTREAAREDEMTQAMVALFGGVAGGLLGGATTRDNYLLFSIYQTDLGSDEFTVLGILGNFVVLSDE